MSFNASIIYRSWRLGRTAARLRLRLALARGWRVTLRRTMQTARKLGLECSPAHWTSKHKRQSPLRHEYDLALIVAMFQSG